ncbi:response regulator [Leptospira levettii]|uniref:response regulator n=1 Tax=Leptospira levettii TaxID=2023178 RepID=UPI000C29964B|nr:response regulator [Leptospira levettii]MCG6149345.1 response regulator [Leptospira levettii]MCW7471928.1 response regulator [Leptospira levettii]PJZ36191.1 response regulator [Leptospira levettii]PJZ88448.1 response regulator [Leptospira levettii]PKA00005.1 response regulator [Leptospira levettii]
MKIKILYVDDEDFNLQLFKDIFKKDFEVFIASSGNDALEELEENREIQYLVSDLSMPQMDGLELVKRVKANYPTIICSLLTGFEKTLEIEKAISEGTLTYYFAKPLDPAEIRKFFSVGS